MRYDWIGVAASVFFFCNQMIDQEKVNSAVLNEKLQIFGAELFL